MNCLGPGHSNRKVTKIAKHLVRFREYMSLPVELLEQPPLQSLCPWNLLSCMKCFFIVIVSNLNTNAMLHSYEPDTDVASMPSLCPSAVSMRKPGSFYFQEKEKVKDSRENHRRQLWRAPEAHQRSVALAANTRISTFQPSSIAGTGVTGTKPLPC